MGHEVVKATPLILQMVDSVVMSVKHSIADLKSSLLSERCTVRESYV